MSIKELSTRTDGQGAVTEETAYTVLFVISFCHFLNDMIQSVIPAVYPLVKSELGLSFTQIGLITLVFQLTSSILQPFVGRYADRHPRSYSLGIGMCLSLVGLLMLSWAGSFGMILMAVGIIGCGSSIFHPEASQVAQMAAGRRKGLAQSIFQVGGNGGNAVGPLLVALIVMPVGQGAVRWFAVAAVMAAAILVWIGRWYARQIAGRVAQRATASDNAVGLARGRVRFAMFILVVLMFSKHFYTYCMTDYFTFFLIGRFGLTVQQSQICLFAYLAASVIGIIIGGALGDRYGRKYIIWGSILGAAPFTMLLPYVGLTMTIVLSIIIGMVISSAFSAILVYATDLMPGRVGMVAGMFFGLSFGLGGLGSAFFGWLADRTSIDFIFRVSTLLPLLGVVAALLPGGSRESYVSGGGSKA